MIRRRPLLSFFLLIFLIGWSPWPLFAAGLLHSNFLPIAPLAATLIVVPIAYGRAGLLELGSRLVRWRVPWYCYVAAVGVPLAVIVGSALLIGGGWSFGAIAWADVAILFALRFVNPMDGPLGEEPGYRGFALPGLQQTWSPLRSAALLGAVVALWHLPLVFHTAGNPIGWLGVPTTFVITFFYCWLFNRSGGSVLITLLAHVVQGTIVPGTFGYEGAGLNRMMWLGFAAWTVIAIAVVVLDRTAWRSAPPPVRRPDGAVLTTPVVQP